MAQKTGRIPVLKTYKLYIGGKFPRTESVATSNVPGGVINPVSGFRAELAPHFASHMDINATVETKTAWHPIGV